MPTPTTTNAVARTIRRVWQTLTTPRSTEVEHARREYITKVISVIMSVVTAGLALLFGVGRIAGLLPLDSLVITLALALLFGAGWRLADRGHWRLAGYFPPAAIFLVAVYGNRIGGASAPAMVLYALAIVLTATLQGFYAQWVMLLCCIGAYVGIGWALLHGHFVQLRFPETAFANRVVIAGGAYIGIAGLLWFLAAEFRRALAQARAYAEQVNETNRALSHEIEERIRAEAALTEKHALLQQLIDSTPDHIYAKDCDHRFLIVNRATLRTMGLEHPDDVVGKTDADFHAADKVRAFYEEERRVLESGRPLINREDCLHDYTTGTRRWVLATKVTLRDPQGNIRGLVGFNRDITERKHMEEALQSSAAGLKEAQRIAHVGSWELDIPTHRLNWSDEAYRIFELDPACFGAEYQTFLDAIHPEDRDAVHAAYTTSIAKKTPYDTVHRLLMPDGRVKYVHERCETAYDQADRPVRSLGTVQDITETKIVENELRHYRVHLEELVAERTAELEVANKELNDFAYVVSHDLKAPLRAISRLVQWLIEDYAGAFDARANEMAALLVGRVQRMDALIDGILQYSRVGRIIGRTTAVDLNRLAPEVIDLLAPPSHIRIIVQPDLPVLTGDHTRMAQVFQNLIGNAVKFMDKPQGEIVVSCAEDGAFWRFSVADDGPGIDPRYAEKIFQIFQTLQARDTFESTGVGLAIVKKIVELHGGAVWVESTPGLGSVFAFTWPKQPASDAPVFASDYDHTTEHTVCHEDTTL